jgi:hypothetical protein
VDVDRAKNGAPNISVSARSTATVGAIVCESRNAGSAMGSVNRGSAIKVAWMALWRRLSSLASRWAPAYPASRFS